MSSQDTCRVNDEVMRISECLHDQQVRLDTTIIYNAPDHVIKVSVNFIREDLRKLERNWVLLKKYNIPMYRGYLVIRGVSQYSINRDQGLEWYNFHSILYHEKEKQLVLLTSEGIELVMTAATPKIELVRTVEPSGYCSRWHLWFCLLTKPRPSD